ENHPGMQPDVATTGKNASQKVIPYMERLRIKNLPERKYSISRAADGSRRLIPSIRALADTVLTSPRLTAIATLSPFFHWMPVEPGALYRVTLSDANGVIWRRETNQTLLQCPAPLAWGKSYQWSVSVKEPLKPNPAVYSTNFQVIPEKDFPEFKHLERKIINLRGSSRSAEYYDLILGYTYLKYNLTEMAVPLFQKIAISNPEAPFIHESLCRLYLEQNYSTEAQKEFAIWTQLTAAE
ncbi:hypothetical protein KAH55_09825, partial [bacterium]|nr:hypothetical protein [bacterium]